jgi:hypothetical protein
MDPAGLDARASYTPPSSTYPATPATPATPANRPATEPAQTRPGQPASPAATPVQDRFDQPRTSPERRAQGDTFTPASTGPNATAPTATKPETKGNPWDFRGGPDSEVGKTIQGMVDRARTSTARISGQTPESLLTRSIFANRDISNEQIMAMSRMTEKDVASTQKSREATEKAIPDARNHPNHKLTVDLFHAVTGVPRETLSRNSPDLGMVGSAEKGVLWKPRNDAEALSTALHDFTDGVKEAGDRGVKGVEGVQKTLWGAEGKVWSALNSYSRGVPEQFLDTRTLHEGDGSVQKAIQGQQRMRRLNWGTPLG